MATNETHSEEREIGRETPQSGSEHGMGRRVTEESDMEEYFPREVNGEMVEMPISEFTRADIQQLIDEEKKRALGEYQCQQGTVIGKRTHQAMVEEVLDDEDDLNPHNDDSEDILTATDPPNKKKKSGSQRKAEKKRIGKEAERVKRAEKEAKRLEEKLTYETVMAKIDELKSQLLQNAGRYKKIDSQQRRVSIGGFNTSESEEPTDESSDSESSGSDLDLKMPTQNPPVYEGKNRAELRIWKSRCESTFKAKSKLYRGKDKRKIAYAEPFLTPSITTDWGLEKKERRRKGKAKHTWKTFTKFLLSLLGDSDTLEALDRVNLEKARQKDNQTPTEFAAELAILEGNLGYQADKSRASLLFTKLQPEVRAEYVASWGYPKVRQELISRAEAIWAKLQGGRPKGPRKTQPVETDAAGSSKPRRKFSKEEFEQYKKDKEARNCFRCHQPGHEGASCKTHDIAGNSFKNTDTLHKEEGKAGGQ